MTTQTPELAPDAREKFRAALLRSVDLLLEQPTAAAILDDFLGERAVLVLTPRGMLVRAVPPAWADEPEQVPDSPEATPPSNDLGTGVYL